MLGRTKKKNKEAPLRFSVDLPLMQRVLIKSFPEATCIITGQHKLSISTIKFSYSRSLAITYHTGRSSSCSIASCMQGFSDILHFWPMKDTDSYYRHSLWRHFKNTKENELRLRREGKLWFYVGTKEGRWLAVFSIWHGIKALSQWRPSNKRVTV